MDSYDIRDEDESTWNKIVNPVIYVFENYGWYILISFVGCAIFYKRLLQSYWEKFKANKFEREYAAKYHKNPDILEAHMNARERWVQKMQEQYNRERDEQERKNKEKEERKKQELQKKYEDLSGHVLGTKNDNNTNLRPDYNPLMGGGSSSSYRPTRRSPCGGGGCGR